MNEELKKWRKSGKHLPAFLKDFHEQKRVFKAVHALTSCDELPNMPNWNDAHIYTVDVFLWCMARHGYTLQKSRADVPFEDIQQNIQTLEARETEILNNMFKGKK